MATKGFERKRKLSASAAHMTKEFKEPMSGLEEVYFTWGMVSNAAMHTKAVDKLKAYVAVHFFFIQAMVATRVMGDLKDPVFAKKECPVCIHWSDTSREAET